MRDMIRTGLWRRLLGLALVTGVVSQAAGCLLDPQQLLADLPAFAQSFALQALAAYLL